MAQGKLGEILNGRCGFWCDGSRELWRVSERGSDSIAIGRRWTRGEAITHSTPCSHMTTSVVPVPTPGIQEEAGQSIALFYHIYLRVCLFHVLVCRCICMH